MDEAGTKLSVDDFLTTVVSRAASALRRAVTVPYTDRFGVSVSEWRVLSVLAEAREMSFADLVVGSLVDKAQVSRTLRRMQERGLVTTEAPTGSRRKQVICRMTVKGMSLYRRVMPAARRSQAGMIRQLSPADRVATYRALKQLSELCKRSPADGGGD